MVSRPVTIRLIMVVFAAVGISGYFYVFGHKEQKSKFRTAIASRGEISTTIHATGTIEPEEVIDIGAQVAGMIQEFGRDPKNPSAPIDYGSQVEKGTILARIDESLYRAAVKQATANMNQAEANVRQAEANLRAIKSKLVHTKRDWDRVQRLVTTKALSDLDIDTAKNAFETAEAGVPAGEAAVEAAQKSVEVCRATLETAQINLNYCTITSPVKGVIVARRVNIGQTVVASLSAPSLFLLAKDLTRLQIWASVNEADIGHILPGQRVRFQVAAYPEEQFYGKVLQIRLDATMNQNVVTYTVVIGTDNPKGRLLPYMTATLDFEVERRASALRVPSAALRWEPAAYQVAPEFRSNPLKSVLNQVESSGIVTIESSNEQKHKEGRVWVEDGQFVRPLNVRVGMSDGLVTEIVSGELQEGTPVVVGESTEENTADSSNPFAPKLPTKK
jgi:HlyD family secretion protein